MKKMYDNLIQEEYQIIQNGIAKEHHDFYERQIHILEEDVFFTLDKI